MIYLNAISMKHFKIKNGSTDTLGLNYIVIKQLFVASCFIIWQAEGHICKTVGWNDRNVMNQADIWSQFH